MLGIASQVALHAPSAAEFLYNPLCRRLLSVFGLSAMQLLLFVCLFVYSAFSFSGVYSEHAGHAVTLAVESRSRLFCTCASLDILAGEAKGKVN
jgi:hypothetical protein